MNLVKHYAVVTGALMALLLLTVMTAYVNLGPLNTSAAMLISLTKGLLIVLFFMRLRQESALVRLFACAGFIWLALLLLLTLTDFLTR